MIKHSILAFFRTFVKSAPSAQKAELVKKWKTTLYQQENIVPPRLKPSLANMHWSIR